MTRKCSHCSHNGHNSRTCPNRGVKIFGVRLTDGSIRKSASMGNLSHYMGASGSSTPQNGAVQGDSPADTPEHAADGYGSEDFVAGSASRERKKGIPWTEEEHRMFLLGMQKLGKGDWRGIARNYVISRTPTQVASHAQKYFIRQTNMSRRKRRSSLFDIVPDESVDTPLASTDFFSSNAPLTETQPSPVDEECESQSMGSANSNDGDTNHPPIEEGPQYPPYPLVYPAYVAAPFFPISIPYWPGYNNTEQHPLKEEQTFHHQVQVLKPTAVHSKTPINVDDLVGMSKLSLGESSTLSLKLVEGSSTRPSAFHANRAT